MMGVWLNFINILPPITTSGNVMKRIRELKADWARHVDRLSFEIARN
jgi:hypothetical protein